MHSHTHWLCLLDEILLDFGMSALHHGQAVSKIKIGKSLHISVICKIEQEQLLQIKTTICKLGKLKWKTWINFDKLQLKYLDLSSFKFLSLIPVHCILAWSKKCWLFLRPKLIRFHHNIFKEEVIGWNPVPANKLLLVGTLFRPISSYWPEPFWATPTRIMPL